MIKIMNKIMDYINNILCNKLHKPYMLFKGRLYKVNCIRTFCIDTMCDDMITKAIIESRTFMKDVITNKDYVLPVKVYDEDECEKLGIDCTVSTISLPATFTV